MATDGNKVRLRIARQDRMGGTRYWQRFSVPHVPQMNVISCLQAIAAEPTTVEGDATVPVAWDCNCLEEICGSCTMNINGRARMACTALVDSLLDETGEIVLEPMAKYPVVRDLVVDRARIFNDLKRIHGWVPVAGYHDAGPGPRVAPEKQEEAYPLSQCISCGCCMEACPQYAKVEELQYAGESDEEYARRRSEAHEGAFMGAAVISQAVMFNEHPTGAMIARERMEALMGPGGITDCGNAQNCVKVCPKNIPLLRSIAIAGRQATVHAIKRWFMR